jgi:hypothetical protein
MLIVEALDNIEEKFNNFDETIQEPFQFNCRKIVS